MLQIKPTDPNLALQLKPMDHVPIGEIELETESKAPNVFLTNISAITLFSEEVQPVVDDQLINQLKVQGLHDQFLAKQPSDDSDVIITGFFSLLIPLVNLIEINDLTHFKRFTGSYTTSRLGPRARKR